MTKIAICFYGKFSGKNKRGEIQGFETSFNSFRKNVLTSETDVFFHGWDDDANESSRLIKTLCPKKHVLEQQIKFDHPYKDYNFVPSGPWNTKDYINNNYSRFYSIKKVMELVDETYDIVLLTRFDTVFYEKIDWSLFSSENFYVSHWNHLQEGWGFNDAWFIGGYQIMKSMSLIYDQLNAYYDLKNSKYFNFIKLHGMNETNITSGHILWKYRSIECGFEKVTYAYGIEYETWGLLRRFNERVNPHRRPGVDVLKPINIFHML